MNRRAFLGLLAGLPFLGRLKPTAPQSLAFHPNAFALATEPMRDPNTKIAIRFVKQWNAESDQHIHRYDWRMVEAKVDERFRANA